jgi:resuscitation-promoting factor RpfB
VLEPQAGAAHPGRGGLGSQAQRPPAPDCHPSYGGACLDPDASDDDCAGGSGNGPEYVDGPITVSGPDPFDLDRDNDGVACET